MTGQPDPVRIGECVAGAFAATGTTAGAVSLTMAGRSWTFVHGDAQPGRPVTPATPFHVCSCSKTFTAAVFSRLVQDGTASWDAPVRAVVPEFGFGDAGVTAQCTFRDVASMRVGLGRDGIAEWGIRQDLPREARLARARHMGFAAPFRERFNYSNLCYIALALAAERLAGKPYASLVQELICAPLGLADSYSSGFGAAPDADAAWPSLEVGGIPARVRELTGPNSEGSARMHLSARDAGTWLRFLLAALAGSDAGPLSSAAVNAMAIPQAAVRDTDVRMTLGDDACAYGMGLFTTRLEGRRLLRHAGGGRGWRHAMAMAPDADVGVMVMAASESPGVDGLALQFLQALLGDPEQDWLNGFSRAAQAAAAAERIALEARFPVAPEPMVPGFPLGHYANPVTGRALFASDERGLRIDFADAPDFAARLKPLGGSVFAFEFDEPALAPQPLDPLFRLRVGAEGSAPVLQTSYFGSLERVA